MTDKIKVFSLVKGFNGGVARYTALLSKLDARPGIEFKTAVINSPGWQCNREDLEKYDLDQIMVKGLYDLSWVDPCVERLDSFSPDLLFVHGDFVSSGLAWLLQKKLKTPLPFVTSYHGFYTAPQLIKLPTQPIRNYLTPKVFRRLPLSIVTVADYCKRYLVSRGVDEEKITVVHNGIDSEAPGGEHVSRSTLGLGEKDIIVGAISRLDPEKGLTYLLGAASILAKDRRDIHLVIVGDGDSVRQLKQKSRRLGIESRVHFVGRQNNVSAWLDLFDIFALPSLAEFHSIALLEAMRAGKAIVATDVGGNTESVRDRQEAIIVRPRNAGDIADAVGRLIDDPELAGRLSKAARARFQKKFTLSNMLDQTEAWLVKSAELSCAGRRR